MLTIYQEDRVHRITINSEDIRKKRLLCLPINKTKLYLIISFKRGRDSSERKYILQSIVVDFTSKLNQNC